MLHFLRNRLLRTTALFSGEIAVTGVWALFDQKFIADHALWFVVVGVFGMLVCWFAGDITEWSKWKKRQVAGKNEDGGSVGVDYAQDEGLMEDVRVDMGDLKTGLSVRGSKNVIRGVQVRGPQKDTNSG